jgi:hypothetical protein
VRAIYVRRNPTGRSVSRVVRRAAGVAECRAREAP